MENVKRKFNIVDFVVIIAILAVLVFIILKIFPASSSSEGDTLKTKKECEYQVVVYTEESPDYALERIEIGDLVCDADHNYEMGEVTKKPKLEEAEVYVETSDGKLVKAEREGYSASKITFVGIGTEYQHGVKFEGGQYSVGQSISIRAGDSKIYGRIYDIKQLKD